MPQPTEGPDACPQLDLHEAPGAFTDADRHQLKRLASAFRFVRRAERRLGERPVPLSPFVRCLELLVTRYGRTESPLERELFALAMEHGLAWHLEPQVTLPVRIADGAGRATLEHCRPDFVVRSARLAVFVDGLAVHGTPDAIERDAAVTFALNLTGWRVLRVHARALRERPRQVVEQLRQALTARAVA